MHIYTFSAGFRRILIIRSTQQPVDTIVFHDYGLTVIKQAASPPHGAPLGATRRSSGAISEGTDMKFSEVVNWHCFINCPNRYRAEAGWCRRHSFGDDRINGAATRRRTQNTTALIQPELARLVPSPLFSNPYTTSCCFCCFFVLFFLQAE